MACAGLCRRPVPVAPVSRALRASALRRRRSSTSGKPLLRPRAAPDDARTGPEAAVDPSAVLSSSHDGADPYAAVSAALQGDGQTKPTPPPAAAPPAAAAAVVEATAASASTAAGVVEATAAEEEYKPDATIDAVYDPAIEAAAAAAAAAAPAGVAASLGLASLDSGGGGEAAKGAAAAGADAGAAAAAAAQDVGLKAVGGRVLSLALPLMVQNLAGYSISIIGAIFIGRLGPLLLSASILANSFYNCTGLSIAMGLSAGLETLCGQAYGAGNYKTLGLLLQRALLICIAACVPIGLLWLASPQLLVAMGQEPEIAAAASRYLILCIPCLFLSISCECLRKYLQSQRDVRPAVVMAATTTAAAPFLFWACVIRSGWGLDGAALAFVACQAATLAGLVAFAAARARRLEGDPKQTWGGLSREALSGWGEYLHYGVPAAAHICLEWWAMEVVILWAGLLPDAQLSLSTMGLCLSINAYLYMLPLGLSSSVNTNIATALGAGDGPRARAVFLSGLGLSFALQAALVTGLLLGGHHLVSLFCPDPAVVSRCLAVLPLLACLVAVDGLNSTVSGVLRGSGHQKLGAAINFLGYWVIGLPLSWALAFPGGMGQLGLWGGLITGAGLQAVVLLAMLSRWDWGHEAARVRRRMAEAAARGDSLPPGLAGAH